LLLFTISLLGKAQITDSATLRFRINNDIVPNSGQGITAQKLNNILNGNVNVMGSLINSNKFDPTSNQTVTGDWEFDGGFVAGNNSEVGGATFNVSEVDIAGDLYFGYDRRAGIMASGYNTTLGSWNDGNGVKLAIDDNAGTFKFWALDWNEDYPAAQINGNGSIYSRSRLIVDNPAANDGFGAAINITTDEINSLGTNSNEDTYGFSINKGGVGGHYPIDIGTPAEWGLDYNRVYGTNYIDGSSWSMGNAGIDVVNTFGDDIFNVSSNGVLINRSIQSKNTYTEYSDGTDGTDGHEVPKYILNSDGGGQVVNLRLGSNQWNSDGTKNDISTLSEGGYQIYSTSDGFSTINSTYGSQGMNYYNSDFSQYVNFYLSGDGSGANLSTPNWGVQGNGSVTFDNGAITSDGAGKLKTSSISVLDYVNGYNSEINSHNLTQDRTYSLSDKDGTIAMLDDLSPAPYIHNDDSFDYFFGNIVNPGGLTVLDKSGSSINVVFPAYLFTSPKSGDFFEVKFAKNYSSVSWSYSAFGAFGAMPSYLPSSVSAGQYFKFVYDANTDTWY